jgi:hypothetical protein
LTDPFARHRDASTLVPKQTAAGGIARWPVRELKPMKHIGGYVSAAYDEHWTIDPPANFIAIASPMAASIGHHPASGLPYLSIENRARTPRAF